MLAKKVDTLNKAMEVEAKKMRREVASMEKEVAALRVSKENDHRARRASAPRVSVHSSQSISARSIFYLYLCYDSVLLVFMVDPRRLKFAEKSFML